MPQDRDHADDVRWLTLHLEREPLAHPVPVEQCDPPANAISLRQFVLDESGRELTLIKTAFDRLAGAGGTQDTFAAADAFAAAVYGFHETVRRRLVAGEVLAFGRPLAPWSRYRRISPEAWRYLVWGNGDDFDGLARQVTTRAWQRPPSGARKTGDFDGLSAIELLGGWDLAAEVAFRWFTTVRLDEVVVGACTQPFKGTGWRVLGLEYACPLQRLVECVVADAESVSPEEACRGWLAAQVAAGSKRQSKPRYREEAQAKWPRLSRRAFDRLWAEVMQGATGWGKAGRPKK